MIRDDTEEAVRVPAALVSLLAVAAIVAGAVTVIGKDQPTNLAVEVKGVPGYIYYDRTYDLTIEYANLGGPIDGPVELVAELPETFALAEHIGDPTRHGEKLVWTLDGLDAGERGAVSITVQGTLPDDLTNAVYDLPGYEGHTAFVEGFDLGVSLTAGDVRASTLAVAHTGAVGGPPAFSKSFAPNPIAKGETSTLTFTIDNANEEQPQATSLAFTDNLPAGVVVATPANASNGCGGTLTATEGSSVISLTGGTVGGASLCTIAVDVTSDTEGAYLNTTGDLTSSNGNSGTASDTLTVEAGSPPPSEDLLKDTDPEDEVLHQFEEFDWYITVPDTGGDWYLWDFLPPGFFLTDIGAALGIECGPVLVFGLVCSGHATEEDEGELITLTVRASVICGEYTNVAKLFTGLEHPLVAHDSVTVCGEEEQESPEELAPEDTRSESRNLPWWERLWTLLFE